jgi:hypothetical protein
VANNDQNGVLFSKILIDSMGDENCKDENALARIVEK